MTGRHVLYSDGNPTRIAWAISTGTRTLTQRRTQAKIYHGRVSEIQARFIALHVGLFWGIGVFAIRNGDDIRMVVSDPAMPSYMKSKSGGDAFIDGRIRFVDMLLQQRGLRATFRYAAPAENIATPLLE